MFLITGCGVFDFNKIFKSQQCYFETKDEIKQYLSEDFLRRREVYTLKINDVNFEMTLGKILMNILVMRPFADFGVVPSEVDVFDKDTVTQGALDEYFNHIIKRFRSEEINTSYDVIRTSITNAMNEMSDLSGEYNVLVGNSVSFRDLIRLEVEDPEFNEIVHPVVKPGQFNDIERQFDAAGKRLMNYFKEHKDTELHPFVASGTGINKKQFTQAAG